MGNPPSTLLVVGSGPVGRLVVFDFLTKWESEDSRDGFRCVWLVRNDDARRELSETGLKVRLAGASKELEECFHFGEGMPVKVVDEEEVWRDEATLAPDAVITCVKAFSLDALIERIRERWPDVPVVAVSNGLIETDSHHLGVLYGGGTIQEGALAYIPSPRIAWGIPSQGGGRTASPDVLRDLFSGKGIIEWEESKGLHRRMLEKVIVNSVVNPITALFNAPNEIVYRESCLTLVRGLVCEACAAMNAHYPAYSAGELVFDPEIETERVLAAARDTALNFSSMLEDVRAGRETEAPWLSGKIAELADSHSLPAPLHKWVLEMLDVASGAQLRASGSGDSAD